MEFNRQELANFFNTTIGTVKTNFPKLRQRALKQGYLIQKRGSGENSIYEVTKTEPKDVSVQELSTYKKKYGKMIYQMKFGHLFILMMIMRYRIQVE